MCTTRMQTIDRFSRNTRITKGVAKMTMRLMMVLGIVLLVGVAAAQDSPALKSQKEKVSYALGMDLGNQFRKRSVDVDPVIYSQGLKDALSGNKTLLTEEEA